MDTRPRSVVLFVVTESPESNDIWNYFLSLIKSQKIADSSEYVTTLGAARVHMARKDFALVVTNQQEWAIVLGATNAVDNTFFLEGLREFRCRYPNFPQPVARIVG